MAVKATMMVAKVAMLLLKDKLTKPRLLIFGSLHHCVAGFPVKAFSHFFSVGIGFEQMSWETFLENVFPRAVRSYLWLVSVGFLLYLNVSQRTILFWPPLKLYLKLYLYLCFYLKMYLNVSQGAFLVWPPLKESNNQLTLNHQHPSHFHDCYCYHLNGHWNIEISIHQTFMIVVVT